MSEIKPLCDPVIVTLSRAVAERYTTCRTPCTCDSCWRTREEVRTAIQNALNAPAPESAASDPLRAVRALCDHYLVSSVPARVLARHVLDALDATPTRDTTYSEYVAAKMAGELNE